MNRKNNAIIGFIFIALGILFLLRNMNIFNIRINIFDFTYLLSNFWATLFIIVPGVLMHMAYFSGKNRDAGILVPGGILVTIGLTLQLSHSFGLWSALWPGFILAVAVGLFELYLFGNRDKGLLIPVCILGGLSIVFFAGFTINFSLKSYLIPIVLILIGLGVVLKNKPGNKEF